MTSCDSRGTFVSVVVPAYNESGRIGVAIRRISEYLAARGLSGEIIVVDDGSRDGTVKEAESSPHGEAILRVLRNPVNRGKGFAIKCGVLAATGHVVLFTDADLSVPLQEFDKFLVKISQGADIVIGSRRLGGSPLWRYVPAFLRGSYQSQIRVHQPFYREALGEVYHRLVGLFLGLKITDTNCGFKCFRADMAKQIFGLMTIERWGFDAEILLLAQRNGFCVEELEVEWYNSRSSKVNLLTAPLSSLAEVLRIKVNDLNGRYRTGSRPPARC